MLARVIWASCLLVLLVASPLAAQTDTSALRNAITVSGVRSHLQLLQNSANANGGTRASGTPGHEASALYVQERLQNAGYDVVVQHFQFTFFEEVSPAQVSQVEPGTEPYADGTDFLTMRLSGTGSMEGVVVPTNDIIIPASEEPSSTSGCELTDFPPAPDEPAVALVQRGGCPFQAKVVNAAAAGYDAVMIFNEGQEGRRDVQPGTLDTPVGIPVLTASFGLGESLYALTQEAMVRVRIETDTKAENRNSTNVIAESADGDSGRVVVVGAHLDSVLEGPGINDNGTGVAAILEVALQLKQLGIVPENRVRFAFWGAEEWGLIGSQYYIDQLSASELGDIMLNLNFDMLGSPNPVRFVLDGDGSHVGPAGPPGSADIEKVFLDYFQVHSLSTIPAAFNGLSDYGPFIDKGIAAGGVFSGGAGIKTDQQAIDFGGNAGDPYDRCYHKHCDDITNISDSSLDELSDAAAHSILHFATFPLAAFINTRAANVDRLAVGVPMSSLPYRGEGQLHR